MPAASAAHPRDPAIPATRWAAHQRTQNLYQTFPEYPLLFEKAVICLFSHGPVAWPLLGRRCWWPYPSPRRHSQRTRAPGHLTPRPGGQPLGYIRESAACASTHTLGWVVACSWPCWASTTLPDASACRLSSRISASRSLSAASIAS